MKLPEINVLCGQAWSVFHLAKPVQPVEMQRRRVDIVDIPPSPPPPTPTGNPLTLERKSQLFHFPQLLFFILLASCTITSGAFLIYHRNHKFGTVGSSPRQRKTFHCHTLKDRNIASKILKNGKRPFFFP